MDGVASVLSAKSRFLVRAGSLVLLLGCAVSLWAQAAATPANAGLAAAMDRLVSPLFTADAPGAAIIVVKDGQTIFRKGYGLASLELSVPIRPEMVFRLASVTKQFTAAAIMMLVEQGKLSLDDDVTKYLPDFPTGGKKITIENLLTHTSGVKDYIEKLWPAQMRQDLRLERLIDVIKKDPIQFDPGTREEYSNSNYILLGAILEKVSGKPYRRFIEDDVFKPLGMKHSYYEGIQEVIPNRTSGYLKADGVWFATPYYSTNQLYSAGALCSSVDDLALWNAAIDSGKLLTRRSWDRVFTPFRLSSGESSSVGFGWVISSLQGRPVVSHAGGVFGSRAYVLRLPEDHVYVAVLSNDSSAETQPEVVARRLAAIAIGKPISDPKVVQLDPKALEAYTGKYRNSEDTIKVRREGARLFAQGSEDPEYEIFPSENDLFLVKVFDARIRFVRDAAGQVNGLVFEIMDQKNKLEKVKP